MKKTHFLHFLFLLLLASCGGGSGSDDDTMPDPNDGGNGGGSGGDDPVEAFEIKAEGQGSSGIVMRRDEASNITHEAAELIGNFISLSEDHPITDYGHVYGTEDPPTLEHGSTSLGGRTETGAFSSEISGLNSETRYFFRSYIKNADGEIAYHPQTQSFTTLAEEENETPCESDIEVDQSRGDCSETLTFSNSVSMEVTGGNRVFTSNSIPAHRVGVFGRQPGAINPNAISEQSETYRITTSPARASQLTSLLSESRGPVYSFGILLNGVELDPIAAEPFPHRGVMDPDVNWEWNLEAMYVNIGLDCNNAHVQPTGKYHYHGTPTLYLENADIPSDRMTLVGYAADGFPIYYKYAYSDADNAGSGVQEMKSSYRLKTGKRPGDGASAPCDEYTGVYSNDFEFVSGLGDLDEANGRTGVTPEYPDGTFYYLITDDFPFIPRYFRGTPSEDFKIGP